MRRRVMLGMVAWMLVTGAAWAQQTTPPGPQPPATTPAPQPSMVAQEAQPPAAPAAVPEGYVWADACKDCHEAIHDSWSKTKHAKTIDRLGSSDKQAGSKCVGCHITGSKDPVKVDDTVVNANVQCESCHGPGKAHVEAAKAGNPKGARMVKAPPASTCEKCHNSNSPHYRDFFYAALKGLVHKK